MRKNWILVATLLASTASWGAVLVLKGGKRLEVASFAKKGNYLMAVQLDGKRVSYPLAAVDLVATEKANAAPQTEAGAKPSEPSKSPFAAAVAKPGAAVAAITDADVQKVAPIAEPGGEVEQGAEKPGEEAGVVVVGWSTRPGEEGQWEVVTNLVNQNPQPVQDVAVSVRVLGPEGKTVGTGSATYPGTVQAGQEFTVTVTVPSPGAPENVIFSVNWRKLAPLREEPTTTKAPQTQPTPARSETELISEEGPGQ